MYFPAAQRDRAAPIQRLALHEQALSAVDEGTGQFTLGSRWRSNNMRVESEAEAEAKSSTGLTFHERLLGEPDYHDFAHVHLVLYESWTASYHRLASVDAERRVARLSTPRRPLSTWY